VFALKLREGVVEGLSGFRNGLRIRRVGVRHNDSELKNSSKEVVTRVALETGLMLAGQEVMRL
jgi:hypothetical protein